MLSAGSSAQDDHAHNLSDNKPRCEPVLWLQDRRTTSTSIFFQLQTWKTLPKYVYLHSMKEIINSPDDFLLKTTLQLKEAEIASGFLRNFQ